MKSIFMRCNDCNNYFGIISCETIDEPICPHCGGNDVDYATENQEDKIIDHMKDF